MHPLKSEQVCATARSELVTQSTLASTMIEALEPLRAYSAFLIPGQEVIRALQTAYEAISGGRMGMLQSVALLQHRTKENQVKPPPKIRPRLAAPDAGAKTPKRQKPNFRPHTRVDISYYLGQPCRGR